METQESIVVMERRDIILTAVFGTFGAISIFIGLCLAAWRYLRDKRSKDLISDCDNGIDSENIVSVEESQQYYKKNGLLNFKTPLITSKTVGGTSSPGSKSPAAGSCSPGGGTTMSSGINDAKSPTVAQPAKQTHNVKDNSPKAFLQSRSDSLVDMYIDNTEPSENVGQIHFSLEYDYQNTTLILRIIQFSVQWAQSKKWIPRKQVIPVDACPGLFKSNSLGRVYTVNPRQTECFYLRLLLVNVTGPLSFQDIRKVDGQQYPTYKDACLALGLLEDDNHWDSMLAEAALNCTGTQIRLLFAIVLTTCFPARAQMLWDNHKDSMTDDILYRHRTRCNDLTISFSDAMYNEALIAIEDLCIAIANLPISHFGMSSPNRSASDLLNTDMNRELQYDTVQMANIVSRNVPLLNDKQKIIYDRIMLAVSAGQGRFFFLDAPGGTGKTFLISLLLAEIRSKNGIALAVASSGIAATLLDGGRTAHSAFKLPLNIQNNPDAVCNIKKQSSMATVLKQCKIIIWDECTMAHKHSLEALDRTLKDIKNNDKLFGGTLLLLSGDFRQTLPVIPRSTYADEINACLKSSQLWRNVEKVQLTVNMRVQMLQDPSAETFSKQLLDIGDGKVAVHENTGCIKLQTDFCTIIDSQNSLIDHIFPDVHTQYANHKWLAERAILAAENVDVNGLNLNIQKLLPGDLVSYKSIDAVCDTKETVNYPIEFLNSLDLPGMPPHHLQLKVGSPIILLRNLNPPRLCNGTRLVIKKLMKNVIEAIILNGKFQGENVLLPRIPMIPTDVPIEFKRTQFPIRLAFAMTINKSQGQTLSVCGLDLETPCFSHGQLYVGCSRVGKPSSLFVLAKDGLTKNIVHSIALRD
ncbi:uncharacterized protein LOC130677904 isoform X2 [Microplitis mediator]|nr:uncharacterized protein LOC130677904 isoform X2 [Microplitis mediator]